MKQNYAKSGVNIDANDRATELISQHAVSTLRPEVLSGVGLFGGFFELKDYNNPVLVSSVDGVGTKLKIANTLDKHDTIGLDIVNHCVNDILTGGAEPLFFLDYIGISEMVPEKIATIAQGLAQACRDVGCALIGGETAEMPNIYNKKDYDLVGFIIGAVEKDKIISGKTISDGDVIIGLPSAGVHTNGYSLVRSVFGETKKDLNTEYPELGRTLGEELLEPHRCYYQQLKPLLPLIKGMAHITGGGLIGNVPRILPDGLTAKIYRGRWLIPPIFQLIRQKGEIHQDEMFRVFNMGIGMAVICSTDNADRVTKDILGSGIVGEVVEQRGQDKVVIV